MNEWTNEQHQNLAETVTNEILEKFKHIEMNCQTQQVV